MVLQHIIFELLGIWDVGLYETKLARLLRSRLTAEKVWEVKRMAYVIRMTLGWVINRPSALIAQ